jgi:hypothetical protein
MRTSRFARFRLAAIAPRLVAAAVTLGCAIATGTPAYADTISVSPNQGNLPPRAGTAGGSVDSGDCGFVAAAPNHQLVISQDISSLRVAIEGSNGLTLLVQGPDGRFCIPAMNGKAEMPGYWSAGTYNLFVGTRQPDAPPHYTLSISAP